jgi:hypothetical protein
MRTDSPASNNLRVRRDILEILPGVVIEEDCGWEQGGWRSDGKTFRLELFGEQIPGF